MFFFRREVRHRQMTERNMNVPEVDRQRSIVNQRKEEPMTKEW